MTERHRCERPEDGEAQDGSTSHEQSQTHVQSSPRVAPDSVQFYASEMEIAAFFESQKATVVRALLRQHFTEETAEEAFDLAVVNLYRSRPPVAGPDAGLARWLRKAAFHRAKELRERAGSVEVELVAHVEDRPADDSDHDALHWRETLQSVMARVATLRPEDRDAVLGVVQRELADMGEDEQAARLAAFLAREEQPDRDLTYTRLHRARTKLRRYPGRLIALLPGRWWRRLRAALDTPVAAAGVGLAAVVIATAPPAGSIADQRGGAAETSVDVARLVQVASDGGALAALASPSNVAPEPPSKAVSPTGPMATSPPSTFRTPPLPVSETAVAKHPRPPGDASLACLRNLGPLTAACVRHPLAPDPLGSEAATVEN